MKAKFIKTGLAVASLAALTLTGCGGGSDAPAAPVGTPLEKAKAFMSTLRSNLKALDASDLSLQTELQKVSDDLNDRTVPLASSNITALNVARLGSEFWTDVIKGSAPFVKGKPFYKNNEYLGGCSFYSDTNYLVEATSKSDAKYVACQAATQSIFTTNGSGDYTQWSYRVRLHPDAVDLNKFTIYTQTRKAKFIQTAAGSIEDRDARVTYGAGFPGNVATFATQLDSNSKITSLNLSGELSPAFSITNNVATVLGSKHNVALSAALTKVGTSDNLAISGSMELFKADLLETRIELATGSYLKAKPDASGSYDAQDGSQEMLLKLKGSTASSALAGDLKIGDFKLDASGTDYIPALVSFNGSVQRNGVTFFEGELKGEALNHNIFNSLQPRSATNVQTVRVGFLGKVIIPNRPVLNVSLSATHKDTGSNASTTTAITGQYVQSPLTINLNGTQSATANITTLESTDGVKLVIDESKSVYSLTQGGQSVGEYSTATNRVTYTDNSYEQF